MIKSKIFFFIIFTTPFLLSQTPYSNIYLKDGSILHNVTLQFSFGDTLTFVGSTGWFRPQIVDIQKIEIIKRKPMTSTGVVVGLIAGATIGYLEGNAKSKNESGVHDPKKIEYSLLGFGIGGVAGALLGSAASVQSLEEIDLSAATPAEKHAAIKKIFSLPNQDQPYEGIQFLNAQKPLNVTREPTIAEKNDSVKTHFTIGLGYVFPRGNFGSTTFNESSGLAKNGMGGRAGVVASLNPELKFLAGIDYYVYTIDPSQLSAYGQIIDHGNWVTITPNFGLQYILIPHTPWSLYVSGSLGLLFCSSPSMTIINGLHSLSQESGSGKAPFYAIGGGFIIAKKVDLNISYGYAKPKFTVTGRTDNIMVSTNVTQEIENIFLSLQFYLF
ncbi:MAG: hypothetical protein WCT99_08280 [Bacteroidota bacterium]|jgi:hypothetical protein